MIIYLDPFYPMPAKYCLLLEKKKNTETFPVYKIKARVNLYFYLFHRDAKFLFGYMLWKGIFI